MPDERKELLELYRLTMDEYHFQVNLNWSRSQYFLVLNAGVLTAGSGVLTVNRLLAGVLFGMGIAISLFSILASAVQHEYYRAIRDGKNALEGRLDLGDLAVRTTPGMGGKKRKLPSVTRFQYGLLALLGIADLFGLVYAIVS